MPNADTAQGAQPGVRPIAAPTGPPSFTSTPAGGIDVTNITDPATRSLITSLSGQVDGYAGQLATIGDNYKQQADRLAAMDQTDPGYASQVRLVDSLANSWASVQNNYAKAIDTRAQTIQKAIDNRWIQGAQQDLWTAQAEKDRADAAKSAADVQIAQGNAGPQRDLLIAQSTAATAQAALNNAQANNLTQKTPAEIQQLQAATNQANANAAALNAQAAKTAQETRTAAAQADVAPRAAEATTSTLESQATVQRANAGVAPRSAEATTGTLEAQRGIQERNLANMPTPDLAEASNVAAVQQQQAGAAQATANVGKTVLGPAFGLQQQMDAIKQIADNMRNGSIPLGTDPSSAIQNMNDMLNRYLQATLGGTTVTAASQQAQQAQENLRQQDITQRQQDTTLQGQGMSGAASAFGSAISPLIGAVKDLPAGSTALGPAAAAMFAPFLAAAGGGLVKPPPSVAAPALPPFMQNFLGGGGQAGSGQAPQTSAPVTINIGGGGGGGQPATAPTPQIGTALSRDAGGTATPDWYGAWQQRQAADVAQQQAGGGLPSFLQGSQVATPDFVDQMKQDTLGKIQNFAGAAG